MEPQVEFDERPPIEMVAGIRFVPASGLRLFALSGLVEKWEKLYPNVREVDPLLDWFEPGLPDPLHFTVGHPFRLWFLDESEQELVQLQADRLLVNWRMLDGGAYPGYPHIKERLLERLDGVNEFLQLQQTNPVQVVGAEISCINSVSVNGRSGGALERVLRPWQRDPLGQLGMPDFATCTLAYSVAISCSDAPGQLVVEAKPNRTAAGHSTMSLSLTFRSVVKPAASIGTYLDEMHRHIISGFLGLTPEELQQDWGRHR